MLLERVWGTMKNLNTRTVDTHMSRLRRRLGLNPENGVRIKTIYQRGYRLEVLKSTESPQVMSDSATHA
jgi:DNA-binding response OmpR family regulator